MKPLEFVLQIFGKTTVGSLPADVAASPLMARMQQCQDATDAHVAKASADLAEAMRLHDATQQALAQAQAGADRLAARIQSLEADTAQQSAELRQQTEAASATYARGVATNDATVEAAGTKRLNELQRKQGESQASAVQLVALRREAAEAQRRIDALAGELQTARGQMLDAQLAQLWAEHDMALNVPTLTAMRLMLAYIDSRQPVPADLQAMNATWHDADRSLIGGIDGVHTGGGHSRPQITATNLRRAAKHYALGAADQ